MVRRETVNSVNAILVLLIMMLAVVRPSAMQETVPNPAQAGLEVASITPNTSGTVAMGGIRFQPKSGELQATNVTLAELLKFAYQRHFFDEREVTGGPAWVTVDRFDLLIRVAGGHVFDADGVPRKTLALLKALLVERFKLKVREEYRERPVYALTTTGTDGVLGPKARKSNIDCGAVIGVSVRRWCQDRGPLAVSKPLLVGSSQIRSRCRPSPACSRGTSTVL